MKMRIMSRGCLILNWWYFFLRNFSNVRIIYWNWSTITKKEAEKKITQEALALQCGIYLVILVDWTWWSKHHCLKTLWALLLCFRLMLSSYCLNFLTPNHVASHLITIAFFRINIYHNILKEIWECHQCDIQCKLKAKLTKSGMHFGVGCISTHSKWWSKWLICYSFADLMKFRLQKKSKANRLKITIENQCLRPEQDHLRWS